MKKKFKIKSTEPKTTVESVSTYFNKLGKKKGKNKVIVGAGIGLAVITCQLKWETKENYIVFSVNGSHGISAVGIVFVLLSALFGLFIPFLFSSILILLIIYYLELTQINQKISEGVDEIKFNFD